MSEIIEKMRKEEQIITQSHPTTVYAFTSTFFVAQCETSFLCKILFCSPQQQTVSQQETNIRLTKLECILMRSQQKEKLV